MRTRTERWVWAGITLLGILMVVATLKAEGLPNDSDKAAAVNGVVITRSDLEREVGRMMRRQGKEPALFLPAETVRLRREALDALIRRELLYQEGKRRGIGIKEEALAGELEKLKRQMGSGADLARVLAAAGVTEAGLRADLERGMMAQRLVERDLVPRATVTDAELKAFYDANPGEFVRAGRVRVSHILVKAHAGDDAEGRAKARGRIGRLRQRIEKGESFAAVAREASDCLSREKGGDLGWFRRGELSRPVEEAVLTLAQGRASEPVEDQYGYHILVVTGVKPEKRLSFQESREKIARLLRQRKGNEEADRLVRKLREGARVEIYMERET